MTNQADKMNANLFAMNAVDIDASVADDSARSGDAFYIYVGTGGDVEVVMEGNAETVIFTNVPDGTWLPALVVTVKTANTTASEMLACWS